MDVGLLLPAQLMATNEILYIVFIVRLVNVYAVSLALKSIGKG